VLALFLQGSASAATLNVAVSNNFFFPQSAKIRPGDTIHWVWNGDNHSSTSRGSMPIRWDSAIHNSGFTYDKLFKYAGTFSYFCTVHTPSMVGTVGVQPRATPTSGSVGTQFTITFASTSITGTNFQAVIQYKVPGGTTFAPYTTATTGTSVAFDSTGQPTGDYVFQVQLKNTSTGKVSLFSPSRKITVTA